MCWPSRFLWHRKESCQSMQVWRHLQVILDRFYKGWKPLLPLILLYQDSHEIISVFVYLSLNKGRFCIISLSQSETHLHKAQFHHPAIMLTSFQLLVLDCRWIFSTDQNVFA